MSSSLVHGLGNGLARFPDEMPLLEKLGFNRQSQLVALVARTFAQIRSADGAGPTP